MVITIANADDFIRALRENEEFRAAARRELLTEDLLQLPSEFRKFGKNVDERFDEFGKNVDERFDEFGKSVDERFDEFGKSVDERFDEFGKSVDERFDEFGKNVDERFDELGGEVKQARRDIDGLGKSFRREIRAQSSFRGNYAINAARGSGLEIASLLAPGYGIAQADTRNVSMNVRRAWLRDNRSLVESLGLRPRAIRTFRRPDIIMAVTDFYSDDEDPEIKFYILLEASYTVDAEDMQRAIDHARITRAVTGLPAYAVVSGVLLDDWLDADDRSRLHDDVERYIEADNPDSVFWYRLNSADMRPEEPC